MLALLLLSATFVLADSGTEGSGSGDSYKYAAFQRLAVRQLKFEQQYWNDFGEDKGYQAAKAYLDSRYAGSDEKSGLAGIIACLESAQAKTPEGLKEIMREMTTVQDAAEIKGLSCVSNEEQAQDAAVLALHSMNPVLKIKDPLANPVLTTLFKLYQNKAKPSRSLYEESIANAFLDAANQEGIPLALSLDYFAHLRYRFMTHPTLYPYYHEALLTDDDRAGIHLLATCIKENTPLGAAASYALQGVLPPYQVLASEQFKCLRTAKKRAGVSLLLDNPEKLLEENFMRLSRALMGANIFLHRDYGDIPSIARDVMFSPVGGISGAGKFKPTEAERQAAIREIMAIDNFVNVKVAGMRKGLDALENYKGTYRWDDERKILLTDVLEKRWREKNKVRIQADEKMKRLNQVVNEVGDCGLEQIQGTAIGEGVGIVLGVARVAPHPYVRATATVVMVSLLASTAFDTVEPAERLAAAFQNFPKHKGAITEVCNDAFGVLGVFQPEIVHGERLGGKFEKWFDSIESENPNAAGQTVTVPLVKKPTTLSEARIAPLPPGWTEAAPHVASLTSKTEGAVPAAVGSFFPRSEVVTTGAKPKDPVSVSGREQVKSAARASGVDLAAPIVTEEKSFIQEKKDKVAKLEKEKPGSAEHAAAEKALAEAQDAAVNRIADATLHCSSCPLLIHANGEYQLISPYPQSKPGILVDFIAQIKNLNAYLKDIGSKLVFRLVGSDSAGAKAVNFDRLLGSLQSAKPEEIDFKSLRAIVHPNRVSGGGTKARERLLHMREQSLSAVRDRLPERLHSVFDRAVKASDDANAFATVREEYLAEVKNLNNVDKDGRPLHDWGEEAALRLLLVLDPSLPKDFPTDVVIRAVISPEGYRRSAETTLKGITDKGLRKETKKEIDRKVDAVKRGSMPFFGLLNTERALNVKKGESILPKTHLTFLGQYWKPDPELLGLFNQVNDNFGTIADASRDSLKSQKDRPASGFVGSGGKRTFSRCPSRKRMERSVPLSSK